MNNDLGKILGMKLDDVANSSLVRSLCEPPKTELIEDRFYMELPASGIAFVAGLDGKVTSIQFHAEGYQGYHAFRGELPEGISFGDNRNMVRSRLGLPSAFGGGTVIQFLGKVPKWDRFDCGSYSVHVQYDDVDGTVNLITLTRADSVPK